MDGKQGGTSSCPVPRLKASPGGDKTRRAFQAGEEKGKAGEKFTKAMSPKPSSLYPLAELGDTTGSSKRLCQPLLPAGASPREELSPRAESQETRGNLSSRGICGAPSPVKWPGQQQQEASEGHALAQLEARVPCTQPWSLGCSAQDDLHRLWARLCPTHALCPQGLPGTGLTRDQQQLLLYGEPRPQPRGAPGQSGCVTEDC